MNNKFLYGIMSLCLLLSVASAIGVDSNPPYLMQMVDGGDRIGANVVFENDENVSRTVTLSTSGNLAGSIILGVTQFTLAPSGSFGVNYWIEVPNEDAVRHGAIIAEVSGDSVEYPITLMISKNETEEDITLIKTSLISPREMYVKQGEIESAIIKFLNPNTFTIEVTDIAAMGSTSDILKVTTPEQPPELGPHDTLSIPVKIDATAAEVNVYTPHLDVAVYHQDHGLQSARMDFIIHVTKGSASGTPGENAGDSIQFFAPEVVDINTEFSIEFSNLKEGDVPEVDITPFNGVYVVTQESNDNTWMAKYKILNEGKYEVRGCVKRNGAQIYGNLSEIKTSKLNETPCTLRPIFNPEIFTYGTPVMLQKVVNELGDDVSEDVSVLLGDTTWNFGQLMSLDDEPMYDLHITPHGDLNCEAFSGKIKGTMRVMHILVPGTIEPNKSFTITAKDDFGTIIEGKATIGLNTYDLGSPITLSPGQYSVSISANGEGYLDEVFTINVLPPLTFSLNEVSQGEQLEINVSRPGAWMLIGPDNQRVLSCNTSLIISGEETYKMASGEYKITDAHGGILRAFTLHSAGFDFATMVGILLAIILIVVLVIRYQNSQQDSAGLLERLDAWDKVTVDNSPIHKSKDGVTVYGATGDSAKNLPTLPEKDMGDLLRGV